MLKSINQVQESRLRLVINRLFGETDDDLYNEIKNQFQHYNLPAGSLLMKQGDEGNSLYLLLGGRLRVFVSDDNGRQKTVGTILHGETVGEMAMLTGEARSASVIAARDCSLAELRRDQFEQIISRHPELIMNISRMLIRRIKRMNSSPPEFLKNKSISVLCTHLVGDLRQWCAKLGNEIMALTKVSIIDFEQALYKTGISIDRKSSSIDALNQQILNSWLDEQENKFEIIVLIQDDNFAPWTKMIINRADILLLVADSQQDPTLSKMEHAIYESSDAEVTSTRYLVLRHEGEIPLRKTKEWLSNRKLTKHFHLRKDNHRDLFRLSRFLSGHSNGLVLSGGGAKGIAHIGVFKALEESGIPVDIIGGASIGAIISGFIAQSLSADEIISRTRDMFLANPTPLTEFSFIPFYSLLKGKRLEKMLEESFGHFDIEDLPINYYCVSSNLTTSDQHVHVMGDLKTAIRASISLPGILPPVLIDKNVYVDGGIFNNIPIDIMRREGAQRIIAVSLSQETNNQVEYDQLPNQYWLLLNKFFGRSNKYKNLPTMMNTIIKSTTIYSDSKEKETMKSADLLFNPDVSHIGLTSWTQFDVLVDEGYRHAIKVLEELPDKSKLD